jgi:hypothetical protein
VFGAEVHLGLEAILHHDFVDNGGIRTTVAGAFHRWVPTGRSDWILLDGRDLDAGAKRSL